MVFDKFIAHNSEGLPVREWVRLAKSKNRANNALPLLLIIK